MDANLGLDQDLINAVSKIVEESQKGEQLDELSNNKLDTYRQKAFADNRPETQEKRSKGRALAFDKQVHKNAVKVPATEELHPNQKETKKVAIGERPRGIGWGIKQAGKQSGKDFDVYDRITKKSVAESKIDDFKRLRKEETVEDFNLEDYTLEEIQDFMLSEEFEQLDELSKATLVNYIDELDEGLSALKYKVIKKIKRAANIITDRPYTRHVLARHDRDDKEDEVEKQKASAIKALRRGDEPLARQRAKVANKTQKQADRHGRAAERYGRIFQGGKPFQEEIYLEDYSLEELEDFMMSEEFEQLDELSKATLSSYIGGAAGDLPRLGNTLGRLQQGNTLPSTQLRISKTIRNRYHGINKAANKLAKEEFNLEDYSLEELEDFMMSEDFEQLDEISGELLGRYIQKARADVKTRYQHGRDLDDHPKVAPLKAKERNLWLSSTSRDAGYDKYGSSKLQPQRDRIRLKIDAAKKKIDPEYPKSVNTQRRGNRVDKALDKLRSGKLTNEQMDEIESLAIKHGLGE